MGDIFADLILEEIFGTTYPYCVVDLDDQGRRTNSVQSACVAPLWEQELTFGVSIQQWILSNLRLQVIVIVIVIVIGSRKCVARGLWRGMLINDCTT